MSIQLNNLTINGGVTGSTFGDPYWSYVTALLHFDGTNGSTTFIDQAGNTTQQIGTAQIVSNPKFGTGSLQIQSSSDGVLVNNTSNLSGSYTIEGWVNIGGVTSGDHYTLVTEGYDVYPSRWVIDMSTTTNSINLRVVTASNAVLWDSPSASYTLGTWAHVAVVNDAIANTFTAFINGVRVGQIAAVALSRGIQLRLENALHHLLDLHTTLMILE